LDLQVKRKDSALDGVKKAKTFLSKDAEKYKASCRDAKVCTELITGIQNDLDPLAQGVKESLEYFQGSEQERTAIDNAYAAQERAIDKLTQLEEQMVPTGYKTPVPEDYADLPQLHGRAKVEMVFKKPDGQNFDINGVNYKEARMTMVIDGYTAPVTGGNFVDLVEKGFYNKMDIQRSDGFVVQTGEPKGEAIGYVGPGSKSIGNGKNGERLIPLEIFCVGDKGPFYESTIEDEGRGGEATVLPFSSYGAMGWARDEYDVNSGSSQFFWLLFDSDLTPAGKNVLDGRYPCFGYVTEGADFLQDIKEGDIIESAKVISGTEFLQQPKSV
jgi:cyclophilin family peptidyl-prolyl cis-trans isomerase